MLGPEAVSLLASPPALPQHRNSSAGVGGESLAALRRRGAPLTRMHGYANDKERETSNKNMLAMKRTPNQLTLPPPLPPLHRPPQPLDANAVASTLQLLPHVVP